jgi:hypothetical protein
MALTFGFWVDLMGFGRLAPSMRRRLCLWLTVAECQVKRVFRTVEQAQHSLKSMDDGSPLGSRR